MISKFLCRFLGLHWWIDRYPEPYPRLVVWQYQYCAHCKRRRAVRVGGGHQPQDHRWLSETP